MEKNTTWIHCSDCEEWWRYFRYVHVEIVCEENDAVGNFRYNMLPLRRKGCGRQYQIDHIHILSLVVTKASPEVVLPWTHIICCKHLGIMYRR